MIVRDVFQPVPEFRGHRPAPIYRFWVVLAGVGICIGCQPVEGSSS